MLYSLLRWIEAHQNTLPGRIVWGVAWGLFLAVAFTILGAILALIRALVGPAHGWQAGLSYLSVIGFYLVAGVVGGALVGLLYPLTRWWIGRRVAGIVVAVPITIAVRYTVYGPGLWTEAELQKWVVTALIWGLAMSFAPEPFAREYWSAQVRRQGSHRRRA